MAAPLQCLNLQSVLQQTQRMTYGFVKLRFYKTSITQNKKKSSTSKKNIIGKEYFPKTETTSTKLTNSEGGKQKRGIEGDQAHFVTKAIESKSSNKRAAIPSFKQILHDRYSEARRSILVRTTNSQSSILSLSSVGQLKHAQFTTQDKIFMLAEYVKETSVSQLQRSAGFFSEPNQFPMCSRILFDPTHRERRKHIPIPEVLEGSWHTKSSNFYPVMNTLDEELIALCERRALDDVDLRIRFFVCLLIEDMVRSILPEARVIPYGSCLNGFGWWNSDLDMMLCFNSDPYTPVIKTAPVSAGASSLRHLTEVFSTERQLAQRTLAMIASLLELTPRIHNVFKILNARVPIIRFKNMAVNLQCDISIQAMDSIKMTELLYLYSVCDPRVKPLMFGLKQWALSHHLTASGEQQKPTTIGILTMLIFYLQSRSPPVVPTLRQIQNLANTSGMFYIDNVLYGLPTNPSLLPKSQNTESIESLLHGFFTFYAKFDFENQALSIIEGITYEKPADSTPVYMENPLCIGLNICRNISKAHLDLFITAMKEACAKLETMAGEDTEKYKSKLTSLCEDKPLESRLSVLFTSTEAKDSVVHVEMDNLFAVEELDSNNSVLHAAVTGEDSSGDIVERSPTSENGSIPASGSETSHTDSFNSQAEGEVSPTQTVSQSIAPNEGLTRDSGNALAKRHR